MLYTAQLFISGYSLPEPTDVHIFNSIAAAREFLRDEHEHAQRFGAANGPSTLRCWHGRHADVTDIYPDFDLVIGPRGGIRKELC